MFGLAFDATEREVHVLFSGCAGYIRCIVVPGKNANQKPYAFIQFDSQDSAVSAMDSRQNTCWEEGAPVCKIEVSKKDIPDSFHARQARVEPSYGPAHYVVPQGISQPPAKRHRVEEAWAPAPPPARYPPPTSGGGYASSTQDGPRTLHVGGLPGGMVQADLDDFLASNFGAECIGGKLTGGGKGKGGSDRAFVGFVSHDAAWRAQGALEGLLWDGHTLHAEWARSEFNAPQGQAAQAPDLRSSTAWSAPPHKGHHSSFGKGGKNEPTWGAPTWKADGKKGGGKKGGSEPKCTLHFTNLPQVSDSEFGEYMTVTFPDQVTFSRFVDNRDGRPPVAWVRFVDGATASDIASSHANFDWLGSWVSVQFARSELDPNKAGLHTQ